MISMECYKNIGSEKRGSSFFLRAILSIEALFWLLLWTGGVWAAQVTLTWEAPTTNTDRTPLTDLAGYKVYYGTASGSYLKGIDVGNRTTHVFSDLSDSLAYFFVVTAYNRSGNESGYSNEAVLAMPAPSGGYLFTYYPAGVTSVSRDPAQAIPIGIGPVAQGGEMLVVSSALGRFLNPVDIYFVVYVPQVDPNMVYVLKPDDILQPLSAGLVPWKTGVEGPFSENLFGSIPTSRLPRAIYYLGLIATPSGDRSLASYYAWITNFTLR